MKSFTQKPYLTEEKVLELIQANSTDTSEL